MLKSDAILQRWAQEVLRCERVHDNPDSTYQEREQAEWKIEAIMKLYATDLDSTMLLMSKIEDLILQEYLNK